MVQARYALIALGMAVVVFVVILVFLEVGRRAGVRRSARDGAAALSGVSAMTSASTWLLTLLLGFTFSGATTRYDHRREILVQQVDVIGTAWQRIDALPAARQPEIRSLFARYFDAVLGGYAGTDLPGTEGAQRHRQTIENAQNVLWSQSMAACLVPEGEKARMLLLPSLNEMFSAVDRERFARRHHPPRVIWVMLCIAIVTAALFAGYSQAAAPRNWLHMILLAAVVSTVTFVIIELEYPRLGIVRVDALDQTLHELRATMR